MVAMISGMCTLAALACALLLLSSFAHSAYPLLFSSALCFVGMFVENMLLLINQIIFPEFDVSAWRLMTILIALLFLLCSLVFWVD